MALVNCPECRKEVSSNASTCPSCGYEITVLKRGFFGKLIKYVFIAFNLLMPLWIYVGTTSNIEKLSEVGSKAEHAGAVVGTGVGIALLMGIWLMGSVILGLFVLLTRPKGR